MIQQSLPVLHAGTAEGNAKVFYGSNSGFSSICAKPVSYAARSDRNFRFAGTTIRKLSSHCGLKASPSWFSRSPTTHPQHAFRITITLHCDFRGRTVDFAQVVRCEFDCERAIVLVEARQLGRARDRNNPRLLRKQPRQRDLRRCRLLLFRDSAQQIHQRLIRFAVFWSEARDDGTEIGAIELGIFGDFASEEAPAERAEWNEPDP